jgi:hypothetical protein
VKDERHYSTLPPRDVDWIMKIRKLAWIGALFLMIAFASALIPASPLTPLDRVLVQRIWADEAYIQTIPNTRGQEQPPSSDALRLPGALETNGSINWEQVAALAALIGLLVKWGALLLRREIKDAIQPLVINVNKLNERLNAVEIHADPQPRRPFIDEERNGLKFDARGSH